MGLATGLKVTSSNLINKYGNSITLIHSYDCDYNPQTGKNDCTVDNHDMKAATSSYKIGDDSNTAVEVGDVMMMVETDFEIINDSNNTWSAVYKGIDYSIVGVYPIDSQDITIVSTLHMRS